MTIKFFQFSKFSNNLGISSESSLYSHRVKIKLNVKNLIRMQIAISAEIGLKVGYWLYTVTAYSTTGPYLNLIHNWLKYTNKLIVNRSRMICAICFNWKLLFDSCLAVHKEKIIQDMFHWVHTWTMLSRYEAMKRGNDQFWERNGFTADNLHHRRPVCITGDTGWRSVDEAFFKSTRHWSHLPKMNH